MQAESRGWCSLRAARTLPWAGGRGSRERPGEGSGGCVLTGAELQRRAGRAEMAASSNSSLSGSSVSSGEFQPVGRGCELGLSPPALSPRPGMGRAYLWPPCPRAQSESERPE